MNPRIAIFAKDIQYITGRTERYARKLLKELREHHGKASHQFVSLGEFCEYTGLPYEEVVRKIL